MQIFPYFSSLAAIKNASIAAIYLCKIDKIAFYLAKKNIRILAYVQFL